MSAVIEIVHAHRNGHDNGPELWPCTELVPRALAEAEELAEFVIDGLEGFMARGESYLFKPISDRYDAVRTILAVGVGLIQRGQKPVPVIVAALVGQTEERGFDGMKGLVNAILRKFSDEWREEHVAHGQPKAAAAH